MRRADYMSSIMKQLGKLSTDALQYLSTWSMPFGVLPILRDYEDGKLMRNVDCDMEIALALDEIVRCRDCKWFTPEYFYEEERGYGVKEILSDPPDCGNPERCSHHYDSFTKKTVPVHIVTDPDGFCAWGERKEGGK